jgi:hypothetical protein
VADQMDVTITVQEPDADGDRLSRLADDLRDALAEERIDGRSRPAAGGETPPGSRGTLETINAVLVTAQASVTLIGAIVATVRHWLDRSSTPERTTSIEVRIGDRVYRVEGATPAQQQELIDRILADDHGDDRD